MKSVTRHQSTALANVQVIFTSNRHPYRQAGLCGLPDRANQVDSGTFRSVMGPDRPRIDSTRSIVQACPFWPQTTERSEMKVTLRAVREACTEGITGFGSNIRQDTGSAATAESARLFATSMLPATMKKKAAQYFRAASECFG